MKKSLLAFFLLFVVLMPAYGEEYKALVIGITEYKNFRRLPNARNDAESVADILEERYRFDVRRLYDHPISKKELENAFDTLIDESKNGQSVLIFFSGHGKEDYWMASDTKMDDNKTYISNQYIIKQINQMKSERVLLISDSCYSGSFFNIKDAESACNNKKCYRWAMTSANFEKANEESVQGENNSKFTSALIKELSERIKEKELTPMKIFPQIKDFIKRNNEEQEPRFEPIAGNQNGNFEFKATESSLPASRFINNFDMNFVYLKPGSFQMGNPESESESDNPPHLVRLDGFYMQTTEVTQAQWEKIMAGLKSNPSLHKGNNGVPIKSLPVERVSWKDANDFICGLNKKAIKPTGYEYQLPTEAQWEYACRAGSQAPFNTGYSLTIKNANYNCKFPYTNCPECKEEENRKKTIEVMSFQPNLWKIYDMHGNVWEWCLDAYDEKAYVSESRDCKNPKNLLPSGNSDTKRVIRGGAWSTDAKSCRCAHRAWAYQDQESIGIGFRVVLVPGIPEEKSKSPEKKKEECK